MAMLLPPGSSSLTRWPPALLYGLGGAAVVGAVAATVAGVRHWRRETPEAAERSRRLRLNAIGRMVAGEIVDLMPAPGAAAEAVAGEDEGADSLAPALVYQYSVGGVTYQASQALHLIEARLDPASWIPGWPIEVKYDPANPGNSIVACEGWSGLAPARRRQARAGG